MYNSSHDLRELEARGVVEFVHFTAADNLPGILTEGLLPRVSLDAKGYSYSGTDDLRLEGRDCTNLSITNANIKMFYGKRKELGDRLFAVLTLDPSLLLDVGGAYEFRSTNAASRFSQPCSVEEVFSGDRPDFFDPSWPTDNQSEILVRSRISPAYIKTIQFPFKDRNNPEALKRAEELAALANTLGFHCDVLFCERHFDYNKSFLGQLDPRERYESYFVSWNAGERAAIASEEAIRLIEKEKVFDSVALTSAQVATMEVHPDKEASSLASWRMRFLSPAEVEPRSNAQLSAFAVMEKIINRGRITRLSPDLERRLSSGDDISHAHQAQCTMIELVKQQVLRPSMSIGCANGSRLGEILAMALDDLKGLSKNICKLYGCEDFLLGVEMSRNAANADVVVSWLNDASGLHRGEVRISDYRNEPIARPFDFTRVVEPSPVITDYDALLFLLKYIFRFDGFRERQLDAIRRGLRRKDSIVLLPTGSGKSVVFQLLSLITPGITFVVCPIISLIEDQVTNLRHQGIDRAIGLSSAMDPSSRSLALEGVTTGQHLICYVSPERFQDRRFNACVRRYASTNLISAIAVDEAHCVSEWGHDFRTAYLGLAHTCREVCSTGASTPPLIALTGTASTSVLLDMMNDLEIADEDAIIQPSSFDRPEIHFRVIRVPSDLKLKALEEILDVEIPRDFHANSNSFFAAAGAGSNCGIIFCQNVNGQYGLFASEKQVAAGYRGVYDFMSDRLPGLCSFYSGSVPKRISFEYRSDDKWNAEKRVQASRFKENATTVMVATKSFGMGIDKPNVRWVIHYGMPGSLESYYQEVGRAARDRAPAYAYLILSDDYHSLNEELLDPSRTPITEMEHKGVTAKGRWGGDDISRVTYFHTETFIGAEREYYAAGSVLEACSRDNYRNGQWYVKFRRNEKESMERAIYRFRLLGVFDSYAIDYDGSGGVFVIKPSGFRGEGLRAHIIESYLEHIRAYQSDSAYIAATERNVLQAVSGAADDRDFIMRAMWHLLSGFVYTVLEEGRRRATRTMLDVACRAADAGGGEATDQELRRQLLAYLSTDVHMGNKGGLRSILNDATNLELILTVLGNVNRFDLLGQASRLLEDYPEHYGLHFVQAAVHALEGDAENFGPSLRAMVRFGTRNYGLTTDRCMKDLLAFFNAPIAAGIPAGSIEKLLPSMAQCLERSQDDILARMSSPQAVMLNKVNALYRIAIEATEGLRWVREG